MKPCKGCGKEIQKGMQAYCSYQCSDKMARKRKREAKQKTPGYWMAKADTQASLYYRSKTPYCEAKDKDDIKCGGVLQWAHIMSRGNKRLRYEPLNHLIMCAGHHVYYTHHPYEWALFIEEQFNDRHEFVKEHRHEYVQANAEYYQGWLNRFTN